MKGEIRVATCMSCRYGGISDKRLGYPYTAKNQEVDLEAVVKELKLGQVVLVAHDASGPPAIDWALNHSNQVAALVLLNTYYCAMPTLRPPEAIFLFSTPLVRNVARPISGMFGHSVECIGGRSVDSLEMPRLEMNSFRFYINSSMPHQARIPPSSA